MPSVLLKQFVSLKMRRSSKQIRHSYVTIALLRQLRAATTTEFETPAPYGTGSREPALQLAPPSRASDVSHTFHARKKYASIDCHSISSGKGPRWVCRVHRASAGRGPDTLLASKSMAQNHRFTAKFWQRLQIRKIHHAFSTNRIYRHVSAGGQRPSA